MSHSTGSNQEQAFCSHCAGSCRRTDGREVYPHLPKLADKVFYVCDGCDARVGAHEESGEPLGTAANAELRQLRITVHNLVDRNWKAAPKGATRHRLRRETYRALSEALGLPEDDARVAMFDADHCRAALSYLKGMSAAARAQDRAGPILP